MSLTFDKPSEALAAELAEVAAAARELLDALDVRLNVPLPPEFPKAQLADICKSLIQLPLGTAEGCRTPLEYSRNRLPAIRREHIRIGEGTPNQDEHSLTRGTAIDNRLAHLISAVSTALDEYRRAAADEEDTETHPEAGLTPPANTVEDAILRSQSLDRSLEKAQTDLKEISKPDSRPADSLRRQLEDIQGINRMGSAEMRMPKIVVGWLRKTANALKLYPQVIKSSTEKLRVGIDILQIAYDRWHEFKHNGVHFIFDEVRKTTNAADKVASVLEARQLTNRSENPVSETPSLTEASIRVLASKGSPMSAKQILAQLEQSGFLAKVRLPENKPYKRIYAAMVHRERNIGDVINVGTGYWALVDWLSKGDVRKIRAAKHSPARLEHANRTKAGMQEAREKGRQIGQPPKFSADEIQKVERLYKEGKDPHDIAKQMGASISTVLKALPGRKRRRRRVAKNK